MIIEKKKYKYIFVVLTYRNTTDIEDFLKSLKKCSQNYKVIMVNSYFDDKTKKIFEDISQKYQCEFINVPNNGYGAGNNRGIELARLKYEFDYLIISNPDIIIEKFNIPKLNKYAIYCGKIATIKGKLQNPMHAKENKLSELLIYWGMKKNNKICLFIGIGISKIYRWIFNFKIKFFSKDKYPIFAAHGSFFAIGNDALNCLFPIFDENIFLFSEEHILAKKAKEKKLPIYYLKSIECVHKEDGSMKLWNGDINGELKKSVIYCYEHYC